MLVAGKTYVSAILLSIPPLIGTLAMSVFTIIDDTTELGIPHVNLLSFIAILLIGFGLHFVLKWVSTGTGESKPLLDSIDAHGTINGTEDY